MPVVRPAPISAASSATAGESKANEDRFSKSSDSTVQLQIKPAVETKEPFPMKTAFTPVPSPRRRLQLVKTESLRKTRTAFNRHKNNGFDDIPPHQRYHQRQQSLQYPKLNPHQRQLSGFVLTIPKAVGSVSKYIPALETRYENGGRTIVIKENSLQQNHRRSNLRPTNQSYLDKVKHLQSKYSSHFGYGRIPSDCEPSQRKVDKKNTGEKRKRCSSIIATPAASKCSSSAIRSPAPLLSRCAPPRKMRRNVVLQTLLPKRILFPSAPDSIEKNSTLRTRMKKREREIHFEQLNAVLKLRHDALKKEIEEEDSAIVAEQLANLASSLIGN
eukprot:CAMPEP_0114519008 /NCGR_PEP_ID=MMETSP0109-20121206/18756_1 /TAXON_ID=29199 /ORGANISM="Chlorarachnion reptans, Strain CCCM449" /LENGTH=329 /DNA_ID=CAMNT_0001699683 /DNA_START=100 /DNA_END=1089 /DNA_ORIENTATION=+